MLCNVTSAVVLPPSEPPYTTAPQSSWHWHPRGVHVDWGWPRVGWPLAPREDAPDPRPLTRPLSPATIQTCMIVCNMPPRSYVSLAGQPPPSALLLLRNSRNAEGRGWHMRLVVHIKRLWTDLPCYVYVILCGDSKCYVYVYQANWSWSDT